MRINKVTGVLAVAVAATVVLGAASCDDPPQTTRNSQLRETQKKFDDRRAPKVTGDAEYQNYMKAQEQVYDDPANILWCTASFNNDASPIFTVPIAGKLTSSSVSFYPNNSPHAWGNSDGGYLSENQSVDGMYHGSPIGYRYGFTPAGQYVDFTGMDVFCTTALTKFQRQTLSLAQTDDTVTSKAEKQLHDGDKAGAQKTVDSAATK
jgi:hypothetical protein